MKKRFTSMFLALSMIMGISTSAFAANNQDEWLVKYDETGCAYLENSITGEKAVRAVRFDENGIPYDVDLIEYAQELNAPQINDWQNSNPAPLPANSARANVTAERYEQSRWYYTTGAAQKVTANVKGGTSGATISYGNSVSVSDSYSGSLSFTATVKRNIQAGASFSWTTSASSSSSFGVTFKLNPGETGYVAFQPRLYATTGTYIRESINTETGAVTPVSRTTVTATCPVKLSSGFADGTYMLMLV